MAKEYSSVERSKNAQKQLRDKLGKFIEMGGTAKFKSGGKTKSGTIIGISGGYAYFLPPIRNKTHSPMPYRVPIGSLEMFKPKATLKDKETRDHEKKLVKEQMKLFESKFSPSQKKDQDTHQRLVKQAKKEKLDVDSYEVDENGDPKLKKNDPIKGDPKIQSQVDTLLENLPDKESFTIPLNDGFKLQVSRNGDKVQQRVIDSDGTTYSSKDYSSKKSSAEISQEIAKDVERENTTPDVGEIIEIEIDPEDVDGDGIPDVSDPFIRPKWQTTTKPTTPSKEDLEAAPIGTTLISEDGTVFYTKTARRTSKGAQWSRYDSSEGGSHKLQQEDVYAEEIADGTPYKKPAEAISEEVVEVSPAERAEKEAQKKLKSDREKQLKDMNDPKQHLDPKAKGRGLNNVDEELQNKLPISAKRSKEKRDLLDIPKEDLTPEILESLPVGTQINLKSRKGATMRVTKFGDNRWYAKKAYNDHLQGEERYNLDTQQVFDDLPDVAQVRASNKALRGRDLESAKKSEADRQRKEANKVEGTTESTPESEPVEENFDDIDWDAIRKAETATNDDLPGTRYVMQGEDEGTTYVKEADGIIRNLDAINEPGDYFESAEEFNEFFGKTDDNLPYTIDEDFIPEDLINPKNPKVSEDPLPDFTIFVYNEKALNWDKVRKGERFVADTPNPIDTFTDKNGKVYDLKDTRTSRNDLIRRLYKDGLIDINQFVDEKQYEAMYESAPGQPTGRFYADGEPILVGDIIEYQTSLHEKDVNDKNDKQYVKAVVTGTMNGKEDIMVFPITTAYGKQRVEVDTGERKPNGDRITKKVTAERSHGPEDVITRTNATRSLNPNKIFKTDADGNRVEGSEVNSNVEGRNSRFTAEDLYMQDFNRVSKGDKVKFRMQRSTYNTEGAYSFLHEGTVVKVNPNNQTARIDMGNGKFIEASVKNMALFDSDDPVPEPEIAEKVRPKEGFRLDSQNRWINENSALYTEAERDSLEQANGIEVDDVSGKVSRRNPESKYTPPTSEELKKDVEDMFGEAPSEEETPKVIGVEEKKEIQNGFGDLDETPQKTSEPKPERKNIVQNTISASKEYSPEMSKYFRGEKEFGSNAEKAKYWANAPVGTKIRLKGGGLATKTGDNSWDYRKSSKNLMQRGLTNSKFANIIKDEKNFLDNGKPTAPTRRKYQEYLDPAPTVSTPSSAKAPEGAEVEVEGDKLTKTEKGWSGGQGTLLSDNQMDRIITNNPEDVKITKNPISKKVVKESTTVFQDSLFDLNDDGSIKKTDPSTGETENLSPEDVDTLASNVSETFNISQVDGDLKMFDVGSNGNLIPFKMDQKILFGDETGPILEHIRYISRGDKAINSTDAYPVILPDGGFGIAMNKDSSVQSNKYAAMEGNRYSIAKSLGMKPREYETSVLHDMAGDSERSLSYDEVLQKLGIEPQRNRQGSTVARAFEDVAKNGANASTTNIKIWRRYAKDSEFMALFRDEFGRPPRNQAEFDKYKKKV